MHGGLKLNIGVCTPKGNNKRAPSLAFALKSLPWMLLRIIFVEQETLVGIVSKLQLILMRNGTAFLAGEPGVGIRMSLKNFVETLPENNKTIPYRNSVCTLKVFFGFFGFFLA